VSSFKIFWQLYPRKTKKPYALKCWNNHNCDEIAEKIIENVKIRIDTKDIMFNCDKKWRPHPSTFINNAMWDDELIPEKQEIPSYKDIDELVKFGESICVQPKPGESSFDYHARVKAAVD
tara:strand:+ start:77 stop:436 length:360 start_codon:yes stop_codon:yes gene_type:complete